MLHSGFSAAARENAETFFIFRKKTLNGLERIKTLKHPSLNLIRYLEEGFFAPISEGFHSMPFLVKVPRIDSLLSRREVRAMGADDDEGGGSSDGGGGHVAGDGGRDDGRNGGAGGTGD